MRFRLIDELDIATLQGHTSKFDEDSYVGLQILVKAKKAATQITKAVMGQVRVEFRGQDIVNSIYAQLNNYSDLLFGMPREVDGASGAYSYYGCFIPFYHAGLPNAIHKEVGETMNFYIESAQESVDEATCYVYGVIDDIPELYVPTFLCIPHTAPIGKIMLDKANITTVLVSEPATTIFTNLQLLVDNLLKYSGSWEILEDFTNNMARIEATALDVILLDMVQKGEINEGLSDSAVLLSTGGSGAFYLSTVSLDFNAEKTLLTSGRVFAKREAKLEQRIKKVQTSDGVLVSVLRRPENKSEVIRDRVDSEIAKYPTGANLG